MTETAHALTREKQSTLEDNLKSPHAAKDQWVSVDVRTRIQLLTEVMDCLLSVADDWVVTANRAKQIESDHRLLGKNGSAVPAL